VFVKYIVFLFFSVMYRSATNGENVIGNADAHGTPDPAAH
jgi:hypothetical protein